MKAVDIKIFNPHEFFKDFKRSGFTEKEAEVLTNAFVQSRELDLSDLATKSEIVDVKSQVTLSEERIKAFIHEQTSIVLKWTVGLMIAFMGLGAGIIKLVLS